MLAAVTPLCAAPRTGGSFYDYGEALQKSILFYKANRLGDLPDDYILPYRGDAAMTDGQDVGLDLTGGWADAGDGVKFGHPMAYAAAQLGWAVYEYRDAFQAAGQLDDILDEIKWATDYFIKAHPSPNVFYYMCGYGESDHSIWAPHEFLEYLTDRKSFKVDPSTPGSDVAGQTAAALAIAAIIFEPTDPQYAATCVTHARQLYAFADTYRGFNPLDNFYKSGSYLDDLAWAAVWLYLKTKESVYLEKAQSYMPVTSLGGHHTHCWDDVSYGAALKLAQATGKSEYAEMVERNLDWWVPDGGLTYTPGGLAWLSQWGSLRYASTAAFLAFVWADDPGVGTPSKKETYRRFAEQQINYALGDNPRNGSYMVGFGRNAPQHPHHRTAHGSWVSMLSVPSFHRHILYGALVGGPDVNDGWQDDVTDYTLNEVATDYNAGMVGALAVMYGMYGGEPLADWPQAMDFRAPQDDLTEFFTRGWIVYEGYGHLSVLIQVNNRSAHPPVMKDNLSTRYFMDMSEVIAAGHSPGDVQIALEASEGATLSGLNHWSGNIYYFELDFSGTRLMPAEWQLCEKEATVSITFPGQSGDCTNDWSYQGLTGPPDYDAVSFAGKTPYTPIYANKKLLWGQEPDGQPIDPPVDPTPTPTPPPDVSGQYRVDYAISDDWGGGGTVRVTITNDTDQPLNGWTLTWTFAGDEQVTLAWSATVVQSGAAVSAASIAGRYNSTIPANGGTANFGFQETHTGGNSIPVDFKLNGVPCNQDITPDPGPSPEPTPVPTPTPDTTGGCGGGSTAGGCDGTR